jgi:hypothetical protein
MTGSAENKNSRYNPGEAVRLLWVWLTLLSPAGAAAYVWMYELKEGNEETLIRVLSILVVSLVITLISVFAFPLLILDESSLKRAGHFNLIMAFVDTIIILILLQDRPSVEGVCQPMCQTYPLRWFALAGMHYCYAIWACGITLIHDR